MSEPSWKDEIILLPTTCARRITSKRLYRYPVAEAFAARLREDGGRRPSHQGSRPGWPGRRVDTPKVECDGNKPSQRQREVPSGVLDRTAQSTPGTHPGSGLPRSVASST